MQIIPAVDVLNGTVVRLLRGAYDDVTVYGNDPVEAVGQWQADGAELVHVVDLAGARSGGIDLDFVQRLAAAGYRFQIGGGIRSVESVRAVIAAGAQRAVVGTAAVFDPVLLANMIGAVGPEFVVVALDVSDGKARGSGWEDAGKALGPVVEAIVSAGATRALVTGIATDGSMGGPDLSVIRAVREGGPHLSLIGSGGVGSLQDLSTLAAEGLEASIVGRALYEQRFTLAEAIAAAG